MRWFFALSLYWIPRHETRSNNTHNDANNRGYKARYLLRSIKLIRGGRRSLLSLDFHFASPSRLTSPHWCLVCSRHMHSFPPPSRYAVRHPAQSESNTSYCFFNKLPVELIAEIFLTLRDDPHLIFQLPQVCRLWHDIALGMSALWGNLMFGLGGSHSHVSVSLERSRRSPLCIHVYPVQR